MPRLLLLFAALAALPAGAQTPHLTLAPLDLSAARFGEAVAAVPDTDGDGVPDIAVGVPNEDTSVPGSVGRVYVFSGASGALRYRIGAPEPARTFAFGQAVAGVPDADGDGAGDVLVGVPDYRREGQTSLSAGRAYLFSGASGALLRTLDTPVPDGNNDFGAAVAGLPDVDGDGRGDLAIGAPNEIYQASGFQVSGRVYVVSGATGAALRTLTVASVPRENTGLAFGAAVAAVPDADADGVPDLAVGAPRYRAGSDAVQTEIGRAYLVSGASGILLHTVDTPNPEFRSYLGTSVAGVPDADGDGRGDLLVGAPGEDVGSRTNAGRAYLVSGATGAIVRTIASPDPRPGGDFGRSVAGVPDLDGDGRGDLLVGAPGEYLNVTPDPGRAHVLSGATGATVATLRGPNRGNPIPVASFGTAVAGITSLTGDGRGAVVVGSPEERHGAPTQTGLVFVYRPGGTVAAEAAPDPAFALAGWPNPVARSATLAFTLAAAGDVRLTLHDALGREVVVVVDGGLPAGRGEATLDVARLAPGVYVARLTAGGTSATARLVVAH